MTRRYRRVLLAGSLLTLSACAQQSEVRQMHRSVSALSEEMAQLNQQTLAIARQNALNAASTHGVYLLPGADAPARLESQLGDLRLSLTRVTAEEQATRVTLRIQGGAASPLPAFGAVVAWGQLTGGIDDARETNVREQPIAVAGSASAPADVAVTLLLDGVTPDRLDFLRIHDIHPAGK